MLTNLLLSFLLVLAVILNYLHLCSWNATDKVFKVIRDHQDWQDDEHEQLIDRVVELERKLAKVELLMELKGDKDGSV